jgi:hypothetical protein
MRLVSPPGFSMCLTLSERLVQGICNYPGSKRIVNRTVSPTRSRKKK